MPNFVGFPDGSGVSQMVGRYQCIKTLVVASEKQAVIPAHRDAYIL